MTHHPTPSDFEARTNATYDALMWALSRPGMPRKLPAPGLAGVIETLIDRECSVYVEGGNLRDVATQTGAHLVGQNDADHLFFAEAPDHTVLRGLRQGSDLYPEEGATVVFPARFEGGTALRLTGPGVDGEVRFAVAGIPSNFWVTRQQIMRYPMGFEVFLIDGDHVIGLPRSTEIEVI